ncbi:YdcF family protein [Desulforudis sp. 1088]|uniref:YdcF family protein n=1 Tax=unclassified Candidatus Desulforudis TaxID=2635950 RepID=UPI00347BF1ED
MAAGVLAAIAVLVLAMLPYVGEYLVVDTTPTEADVIIVLSGDKGERLEHAVELYDKRVAPLLLVSGGKVYASLTAAEMMRDHAVRLGVPPSMIITEDRADNTVENALFTRPLLEERGLHSAVIVSSPYHMRRVKYVFDRVYGGSGIKLTYSPSPGWFDPESWWRTPDGQSIVLSEYLKLAMLQFPGYKKQLNPAGSH